VYTEGRPDDDEDVDLEWLEWLYELQDALVESLGPRASRPSTTEGHCSIEDMAASVAAARDPALVLDTLSAPPKVQRRRIQRHQWMRSNLAVTAIVGVSVPRRTCPVSCGPRHVRPRSRARHSPRAPRGPPDGEGDPEPPRTGRRARSGA
jgi:hypothetical protein